MTTTSSSSPILLERTDAIATITLNRAEQMNALNAELLHELARAIDTCRDAAIRAVVLRGNGRVFCAGGDIRFFAECIQRNQPISTDMVNAFHTAIEGIRALEKPVIAAVHGAAAGGGAPLALACDLVIAADDAVFNFAYARIGLTPDGSATYYLPRHVGAKKAFELFALMPTLTATQAHEIGLINHLTPANELAAKTTALATQLATGPTKTFARLKQMLNASYNNSLHDQLALESNMICASSETHDFREGIAAFLEKRPPKFVGK